MSGGAFDYKQHYIDDIADDIERLIATNNRQDLNEYAYDFSEDTIARFHETVETLNKVSKMVHHIDWLVSGDDGEETFHKRWKKELGIKHFPENLGKSN